MLGRFSVPKDELDIATANLNATIANLAVNLVILGHIQEQITLQKKYMADSEEHHRELLRTLDKIISNQ